MRYGKHCALILIALVAFSALPRISAAESGATLEHAKLTMISEEIQKILDGIDGRLANAAKELTKTGLTGPDAESVLDELCRESPYFMSCATINASGVIVIDRPEHNKKYEGKEIGDQEHIKMLLTTQRPVMSSLFKAVE
jgi:hypothetical protein